MMPKKEISATNARAKPRGKPFEKGNRPANAFTSDDPRRNNNGQRSKEVVATAAQARALYVQVLHEEINAPLTPDMSNLEFIVRKHVKAAKDGDAQQREQMFDRIWGKANQSVDLTSSDGSMTPTAVMFIPHVSDNPDHS